MPEKWRGGEAKARRRLLSQSPYAGVPQPTRRQEEELKLLPAGGPAKRSCSDETVKECQNRSDRQQTVSARAISNAITRLHHEYYGRGANSARTIIHRDYVITFLEDVYTPIERTLIDRREHEPVKETRLAFQRAMETSSLQSSKR